MRGATYPLQLHDGFRHDSKRPMQKNDCTVRAVSIAARIDYDDAYDMLAMAGRKSHEGFDVSKWLKKKCPKSAKKISVRGLKPSNFHKKHPTGHYIVVNHNHCWAVVDGMHYDLIRVYDEPFLDVWRILL